MTVFHRLSTVIYKTLTVDNKSNIDKYDSFQLDSITNAKSNQGSIDSSGSQENVILSQIPGKHSFATINFINLSSRCTNICAYPPFATYTFFFSRNLGRYLNKERNRGLSPDVYLLVQGYFARRLIWLIRTILLKYQRPHYICIFYSLDLTFTVILDLIISLHSRFVSQ